MSAAAILDRDRLVKLCGMFGSDHPGERANAAAAADKMIRDAGMRWPEVLLPALPRPTASAPTGMSFAEAIRFVHRVLEVHTTSAHGAGN